MTFKSLMNLGGLNDPYHPGIDRYHGSGGYHHGEYGGYYHGSRGWNKILLYNFLFFFIHYSFLLYIIIREKIRSNFYKLSEVTKVKMTKELHLAPWLYSLSCSY